MSPSIEVVISGGVAQLSWVGPVEPHLLAEELARQSSALFASGMRRIEVQVPADHSDSLHALHLARFRREGLARGLVSNHGEWTDVLRYSLLSTDPVEGPLAFSQVMNTVLPSHRVIGHAIIRDQDDRLLLVETTYKTDWELPGGIVEPGEPPRIGAQRELLEELGLEIQLGQPLVVDWMPPYLGWDDAIEFIFDGGVLSADQVAAMRLPAHEVAAFHWVPTNEIAAHVFPLSARRISYLLQPGHERYIENGQPIQPADAHLPPHTS